MYRNRDRAHQPTRFTHAELRVAEVRRRVRKERKRRIRRSPTDAFMWLGLVFTSIMTTAFAAGTL